MKREKNMLVAFLLNAAFSVLEGIGGIATGSVAILSDAIHDIGDAASIGVAYFLERKSKKQPDEAYTYGCARFSVIGSAMTTLILLLGSGGMIWQSVRRLFQPVGIHYDGMVVLAILGVCVNLVAAIVTHGGESLNQKTVRLHMLEDVLGWAVVLVGAILMRFTDISVIDPLMSIGVALFILIQAGKNLKRVLGIFLEKVPHGVDVREIKEHLCKIDQVRGVHHLHIWSLDGHRNYATMHVVAKGNPHEVKCLIREEMKLHGIGHVTLELEEEGERCGEECCHVEVSPLGGHHHHHH